MIQKHKDIVRKNLSIVTKNGRKTGEEINRACCEKQTKRSAEKNLVKKTALYVTACCGSVILKASYDVSCCKTEMRFRAETGTSTNLRFERFWHERCLEQVRSEFGGNLERNKYLNTLTFTFSTFWSFTSFRLTKLPDSKSSGVRLKAQNNTMMIHHGCHHHDIAHYN